MQQLPIVHTVRLTLLGLISATLALGQSEVNNQKTEKHQHIKGTKLMLVPPDGFTVAEAFSGFQQEERGASIVAMELPGPYPESTRGFTEEGLLTQGITLINKEEVLVQGQSGMFLSTTQQANGIQYTKYILVFGDLHTTHLLTGIFPTDFPELAGAIRECLLTVIHETGLDAVEEASVPFSINIRNTKLKFGKSIANMLIYTADGKVPTQSHDKTSFIVGRSVARLHAEDKKQACIDRVKDMPFEKIRVHEHKVKEIEINGLAGYELHAEGDDKSTGVKHTIYQVMLFAETGYYIMVGTAEHAFDENVALFERVAKTFKRK